VVGQIGGCRRRQPGTCQSADAHGSHWTFIDLIGHDYGLGEEQLSRSLVVVVGAGRVGALAASWADTRWPRVRMRRAHGLRERRRRMSRYDNAESLA
jgi:hypothetical protein